MDKLVRDKMPELISQEELDDMGWEFARYKTAFAYKKALETKLVEETTEYLSTGTLEELIDVLTVVRTLAWVQHNKDMKEMMVGVMDKEYHRGGLENKVRLRSKNAARI